jgi:hypothetical protein
VESAIFCWQGVWACAPLSLSVRFERSRETAALALCFSTSLETNGLGPQ